MCVCALTAANNHNHISDFWSSIVLPPDPIAFAFRERNVHTNLCNGGCNVIIRTVTTLSRNIVTQYARPARPHADRTEAKQSRRCRNCHDDTQYARTRARAVRVRELRRPPEAVTRVRRDMCVWSHFCHDMATTCARRVMRLSADGIYINT